jgi:Mg-chelatase subunit ChlI
MPTSVRSGSAQLRAAAEFLTSVSSGPSALVIEGQAGIGKTTMWLSVVDIHDGIADICERRPQDRPDTVLRVPASTLAQVLYQRMGPVAAVRHGMLIVGGRRPWKASKLVSYFETV